MSKKHFIALADLISTHRDAFSAEAIQLLANFCKSENSAFKEGRWKAYINNECGPNGGKVKVQA